MAERYLRTSVRDARGSPFIAHHHIPEPLRHDAECALLTVIAGDIDVFLSHVIPNYPHFSLWSLAIAVAEEYGAETDHAVYRLIAQRLGLPDVPPSRRRRLKNLFRFRCNMLGLTLPLDANRHVDDYLFQAGVPVSQLQHLVDAFLHAERQLGSPSLNDTASLSLWENRAVRSMVQRTRLTKVLAEDITGYHASVYFRLRDRGDPETDFERRFFDAIKGSADVSTPIVQPPYLTFSDGELRIAAPYSEHSLDLQLGAHASRLNPGESRALAPPWPRQIRWRTTAERDSWNVHQFFPDSSDIILVFDGESGRHKDTIDAHDTAQHVPGGSIALVSMKSFRANGEPAYQLADDAFALFCDASGPLLIEQDGVAVKVETDPRPRLELDGTRVARRSDGWLLAEPTTVSLRGELIGSEDRIEIRVTHPSMSNPGRTHVHRTPNGVLSAPLNLPHRGPFGMARVSVHLRNQDRALHQRRFWYWPSLKGVRGSEFVADSIPDNLSATELVHLGKNHAGRLSFHEEPPYLFARLVFRVASGFISFNLPPPGVSMFIRTSSGHESPLAIGACLQIGKDEYASHLVLRSPTPDITLDVRGRIFSHPFDKFGLCRIPFALLASGGDHAELRLMPNAESARPTVLLCVDQPLPGPPKDSLAIQPNRSDRRDVPKRPKLVRRRHGRGRRRRRGR